MPREGLEGAAVFRRFEPAFREQHGASLSGARRRAMIAIEGCRTAALGGHVERCGACGHQRIAYDSCRNRNCPKCQGLARAQWIADRQAELLDVPYFHVVFTVPTVIEVIAFQNQTVIYDILFRAASETLRTIAADPEHLGAEIGFLGVLHTWGQNLLQHPHSEYMALSIPAFSVNKANWSSAQPPCKVSLPVRWRRSIILRMGPASKSPRRNSQGARRVTCSPFNRPASTSRSIVRWLTPHIRAASLKLTLSRSGRARF